MYSQQIGICIGFICSQFLRNLRCIIQLHIENCLNESLRKMPAKIRAVKRGINMFAVNLNEKVSTLKNLDSLKGNFDILILEAVDEALSALGDSCKQAIYFHLEKTFKIKRQHIPSKFEEFVNAIEQIFGIGAKIIEIEIMKCLHKKLSEFKYFPNGEDLTLTQYVAAVKTLELYPKRLHKNNAKATPRIKFRI